MERKVPICTEEEIESYVWMHEGTKEQPVKKDDHGMDSTRYLVMHLTEDALAMSIMEY